MASTYEPIASTTLGSNSTSVTLSSIPGGYDDLRVVMHASRSNSGANAIRLRLNNDSGTNYSWTFLLGDGSSASSGRSSSQDHLRYLQGGISQTSTDILILDLMSYANTNVYKTILGVGCGYQYQTVERWVHLWRSTSAVTSINFQIAGSNPYAAGSTFSLYGIKAA